MVKVEQRILNAYYEAMDEDSDNQYGKRIQEEVIEPIMKKIGEMFKRQKKEMKDVKIFIYRNDKHYGWEAAVKIEEEHIQWVCNLPNDLLRNRQMFREAFHEILQEEGILILGEVEISTFEGLKIEMMV